MRSPEVHWRFLIFIALAMLTVTLRPGTGSEDPDTYLPAINVSLAIPPDESQIPLIHGSLAPAEGSSSPSETTPSDDPPTPVQDFVRIRGLSPPTIVSRDPPPFLEPPEVLPILGSLAPPPLANEPGLPPSELPVVEFPPTEQLLPAPMTMPTLVKPVTPIRHSDLLGWDLAVTHRQSIGLDFDPQLRGLNKFQLAAGLDGIIHFRGRPDFLPMFGTTSPTLFSGLHVIDGPYSPRLGLHFGVLDGELFSATRKPALAGGGRTLLAYDANGHQQLYRQTIDAGGPSWGFAAQFGGRSGSDYWTGGFGSRIPASYQSWDGALRTTVDIAPQQSLTFTYIRQEQNNIELPGFAYDIRNLTDDQFYLRYSAIDSRTGEERVVVQSWHTSLRYAGDASRPSKQATMFSPFVSGVADSPFAGTTNLIASGDARSTGGQAYLVLGDFGGLQMIVGTDGRQDSINHNEFYTSDIPRIAVASLGIPSARQTSFGAFLSFSAMATPTLAVTSGYRLEHSLASSVASDFKPDYFLGMGYVNAQQRLMDCLTLHAGTAYSMRAPSPMELFGDNIRSPVARFGNSMITGNTDLDAEHNFQFDLGIRGQWDRARLGALAFHSIIGDYILYRAENILGTGPNTLGRTIAGSQIADTATIVFRYINLDRARLLGGNLFGEFDIVPSITAFGSLIYVKGTNHSPSAIGADGSDVPLSAEGLPNIAPLTGTVGVRWFDPVCHRMGVELLGRLVLRQSYTADSLGEVATPGYSLWSLRGWVRVGERVHVSTAINNAFNAEYSRHGALAIADPTSGRLHFVPDPGLSWLTSVEVTY